MLVARHFEGVHSRDAIVHVVAATTLLATAQAVHKIRFIHKGASHLHSLEATVEHLLNACARHAASHIYERQLHLTAHLKCIIKEVKVLVRFILDHIFAHGTHTPLEPPALHVAGHSGDRHFAAHHIHGSLAHEASTEHKSVHAELFKLAGNHDAFLKSVSTLEAIAHIRLCHHGNLAVGSTHHLLHAQTHEVHAVVERAAP